MTCRTFIPIHIAPYLWIHAVSFHKKGNVSLPMCTYSVEGNTHNISLISVASVLLLTLNIPYRLCESNWNLEEANRNRSDKIENWFRFENRCSPNNFTPLITILKRMCHAQFCFTLTQFQGHSDLYNSRKLICHAWSQFHT